MTFPFSELYRAVCAGQTASFTFDAEGKTYIRNLRPGERLILLGGGHISKALCGYASSLGFQVTVVDDRPSFANSSRFPEAAHVICRDFPTAIRELGIRSSDYVAVLTRGHRWDADCLRAILPGAFPRYLGMIGSKRRVFALFNLLESEGFLRSDLDRIHAPIGLDIGAFTVPEIAISVAGQLVACRREGQPRRGHAELLISEDVDPALWQRLAEDDKPKALLIVYDTSGSTPASPGAMMMVDRDFTTAGSIGGGCSENEIVREAFRMIGSGQQRCFTVEMSNDVAEEEGMVCGGTMKVWAADVSPE